MRITVSIKTTTSTTTATITKELADGLLARRTTNHDTIDEALDQAGRFLQRLATEHRKDVLLETLAT